MASLGQERVANPQEARQSYQVDTLGALRSNRNTVPSPELENTMPIHGPQSQALYPCNHLIVVPY